MAKPGPGRDGFRITSLASPLFALAVFSGEHLFQLRKSRTFRQRSRFAVSELENRDGIRIFSRSPPR